MNNKKPPVKRHFDPYKKNTRNNGDNRQNDYDDENPLGQIEGRNAVIEALRAGVFLDKVYIADTLNDSKSPLGYIASTARSVGSVVVTVEKRKLDSMSVTNAHQGVIAIPSATVYSTVEDILQNAASKGESALIVVCDEITDPHNLGAIIRSAEAAGAHGVIIPKRRGAGLTAAVAKTSAGAVFHLPVARVSNLTQTLNSLKKSGVWIYGTAQEGGGALWETDFSGHTAIVTGSEGSGLSRLVQETCDFIVSIPMSGKVASLNVSAAASIVLFEAVRQRRNK